MAQQQITPATDQTYFKHWNVIMACSPRGHCHFPAKTFLLHAEFNGQCCLLVGNNGPNQTGANCKWQVLIDGTSLIANCLTHNKLASD